MRRIARLLLTLGVIGVTLVPAASAASGPGDAAASTQSVPPRVTRPAPVPEQRADFFFGQPKGWLSFRGGLFVPRADAELFSFLGDQLTMTPSDFRAKSMDIEIGVNLSRTLAVEGGFDIARRGLQSEYRNFVRPNRDPISQDTLLNQASFTIGFRVTPTGHGRRISSLSFIPRRVTPYGAAGLQTTYYRFSQNGSFVDFADLSIFQDVFASDGWVTGPYARGGVDIQLWRRLFVNADLRYSWLRSTLSSDFQGFPDGLDLAGVRTSTGISIKF